MSLFRYSDYGKPKESVHKTKIPTIHKTKLHKCSQCTRKDARFYKIRDTQEGRWLCPLHYQRYLNGSNKETSASFTRAARLHLPQ